MQEERINTSIGDMNGQLICTLFEGNYAAVKYK